MDIEIYYLITKDETRLIKDNPYGNLLLEAFAKIGLKADFYNNLDKHMNYVLKTTLDESELPFVNLYLNGVSMDIISQIIHMSIDKTYMLKEKILNILFTIIEDIEEPDLIILNHIPIQSELNEIKNRLTHKKVQG